MTFFAEDKDPVAILDYYIDWTSWLNGRSISSVTAEAENVTLVEDQLEGLVHRIRVSGGVVGENAEVSSVLICSDGTKDRRSIRLKIKER